MKVAAVIPIYNRPDYVRRCFDSLRKLTVKPDVLIAINDASDCETLNYITDELLNFRKVFGNHCFLYSNKQNAGVRSSLLKGIDNAFNVQKCDNILVLDSDVILKPYALDTLLKLQAAHPEHMISGINCIMNDERGKPRNPLISEHKGYSIKEAVAGQCLLFNKEQYHKWVEPTLKINGNWDHNASINSMKDGKGIIVSVPSVAQHIGMRSAMGHNHTAPDRAYDFKLLSLPGVTLFGIDSHDKTGIERAATISQYDIDFGATNIITKDLFTKNGNREQRRNDYSRFMLKELTKHFSTSHVLTIHADGYVMNANAWDNSWLQYDYIGATWWYKDNMNVGNGGFSLRSKKLCDILAENDIEPNLMHPEDHCICRHYRQSLERDFGIKFAPEEVANKFSIEGYNTPARHYTGQFGFHSQHVDFSNSEIPEDWRLKPIKQPVIKRR